MTNLETEALAQVRKILAETTVIYILAKKPALETYPNGIMKG